MAVWGADIDQLKNLGRKLGSGAGEIENTKNSLTNALEGTTWFGPDADKFRSEWSGTHVNALQKVADAVREAGEQARRNAEEQEHASR